MVVAFLYFFRYSFLLTFLIFFFLAVLAVVRLALVVRAYRLPLGAKDGRALVPLHARIHALTHLRAASDSLTQYGYRNHE